MLVPGSGAMINIRSISADDGMKWRPLSCTASRAAVEGMTKQLAIARADRNVPATTIAANHFVTRMARSFLGNQELLAWVASRTPIRRFEGGPGLIRFLAADASSYVTVQAVHIDGGLTAARGTYQSTPTQHQRGTV
jgi:NAD(P)-dependent dehydrogenase (short-subunit alcohol dehydrogenase family)